VELQARAEVDRAVAAALDGTLTLDGALALDGVGTGHG
jgi:hypothetical protein